VAHARTFPLAIVQRDFRLAPLHLLPLAPVRHAGRCRATPVVSVAPRFARRRDSWRAGLLSRIRHRVGERVTSVVTELSPAQHVRIRLHLALIPAYICLIWSWTDVLSRLPVGPGSEAHRVRDFAAIAYIPGQIANQGDASALYDSDRRAT